MEIRDLLNEEMIIIDMEVENKLDFFEKISVYLKDKNVISNKLDFYKSLLERENIGNTGFGDGLAVPHGNSETVLKTTAMYIRLKNSIDWESFDNVKVKNIFLFAINKEDKANKYLEVLASLSRKLIDDTFIEKIRNSNTKKEIIDIL